MTDLALFESLLSCNTVEDLHAKTSLITERMGFDHFLYGVQLQMESSPPWHFVLSGYPDEWIQRYMDASYQKVDPVVHHCAQKVIPIFWDDFSALQVAPKNMMNEAKDFGLVSGLSFPLRGLGSDFGLFSVSSTNKIKARQEVAHTVSSMQLLATYLHQSVLRIVLSPGMVSADNPRVVGRPPSESSSA